MNQLGAAVVAEATGTAPAPKAEPAKNPHAVALSQLGASKGGKARAKKLSKKRRSEIAKQAVEARWRRKAQ